MNPVGAEAFWKVRAEILPSVEVRHGMQRTTSLGIQCQYTVSGLKPTTAHLDAEHVTDQ